MYSVIENSNQEHYLHYVYIKLRFFFLVVCLSVLEKKLKFIWNVAKTNWEIKIALHRFIFTEYNQ
jgi:hypothetical protein